MVCPLSGIQKILGLKYSNCAYSRTGLLRTYVLAVFITVVRTYDNNTFRTTVASSSTAVGIVFIVYHTEKNSREFTDAPSLTKGQEDRPKKISMDCLYFFIHVMKHGFYLYLYLHLQ